MKNKQTACKTIYLEVNELMKKNVSDVFNKKILAVIGVITIIEVILTIHIIAQANI